MKHFLRFFPAIIIVITMFIMAACNPQKPFVELSGEWIEAASGLDFPEGPAWDGSSTVYVSNCYGGWITRHTAQQTDTLPVHGMSVGKTNGLTFHDGFLYACDFGIGAILKIAPSGSAEFYVTTFQGMKFNRPNDLAFDANGNLYCTDPSSYGADKLDGRVFRFPAGVDTALLVRDSLAFPNGIAFSPVDAKLYVCESAKNRILRFSVNGSGDLEGMEEFARLPGGDPDGIAFDVNGNLYVAHFGTGTLFILSPQGKILQRIPTPGKKPTNVEFGGAGLKMLYLTETETNALYEMPVTIPGMPLN